MLLRLPSGYAMKCDTTPSRSFGACKVGLGMFKPVRSLADLAASRRTRLAAVPTRVARDTVRCDSHRALPPRGVLHHHPLRHLGPSGRLRTHSTRSTFYERPT